MPCRSDFMEPNARERESVKVKTLLHDLELESSAFNRLYGDIHTLDADTARLCEWCKTNDVTKESLELQIWWRDHQIADKKREETEHRQQAIKKLAASARQKLTADELDALLKDK